MLAYKIDVLKALSERWYTSTTMRTENGNEARNNEKI